MSLTDTERKDRKRERNRKWREANKEKTSAYNRDYYTLNHADIRCRLNSNRPEPSVQRKYNLKSKYGITIEQHDAMLVSQNFRCAVCETAEPQGLHNTWHTDHCHETGIVRGLLCHNCNLMLGLARDNTATLARAIKYIERA